MITAANFLVTGSNSGLGKFLKNKLNAVGFTREDDLVNFRRTLNKPLDAIIHCAYNVKRNVTSTTLQHFVNDNLLFTKQLLDLPHHQFIFISSSDVYPDSLSPCKESDEYLIQDIKSLYGLSKLMCEKLVNACGNLPLILRPTAMLGKDVRANSLIKILFGQEVKLTLSKNSRFNYILHDDVLQFIEICIAKKVTGIFNLAAKQTITLDEVIMIFKRNVVFGTYEYKVANICNQKVTQLCKIFANSSLENIKRFLSLMEASDVKRFIS